MTPSLASGGRDQSSSGALDHPERCAQSPSSPAGSGICGGGEESGLVAQAGGGDPNSLMALKSPIFYKLVQIRYHLAPNRGRFDSNELLGEKRFRFSKILDLRVKISKF